MGACSVSTENPLTQVVRRKGDWQKKESECPVITRVSEIFSIALHMASSMVYWAGDKDFAGRSSGKKLVFIRVNSNLKVKEATRH